VSGRGQVHPVDLDEVLAATFTLVAPHLTERQRRLLFGAGRHCGFSPEAAGRLSSNRSSGPGAEVA
jgi:hypothetical protein